MTGTIDLRRTFKAMLDAGDAACVMEVSSHALELGRADATHFPVAIFTNLTQDHLDFHETMEDCFIAKRRLFVAAGPGCAVINVDDPCGRRLASEVSGAISFGIDSGAAFRAVAVETDISGFRFTVATPEGGSLELSSPLRGRST